MKIKVNKTLYKIDSKGKLREWSIYVGNDEAGPYYSVVHGLKDGAMQESRVNVPSGKNTGRANETTAQQQCLLEAEALHKKQVERKGYSEATPTTVPHRPMLAYSYKDFQHKIEWPACVSPKLDGIRVLVHVQNGRVTLVTRTGKEIGKLPHLVKEAQSFGNIVLDGELYSDEISFQEITSIVRKSKTTDPRFSQIYVYVFDVINDDSYHQRVLLAERLIKDCKYFKIVPWFIVKNNEEVKYRHHEFVKDGYEGSMVRNLNSKYELNKRSYNLLKNKDFLDGEFEIIGYKTGVGKFTDVPTFLFKIDNTSFEAVPIGTKEQRAEYLRVAENLIGKKATIKYFELTDDGIPRFPVVTNIDRSSYE